MNALAPLASLLGIEVEHAVARARATAIVTGLIVVLLIAAFAFLTVAGYLALADLFNPPVAALMLSGLLLVLALAVYAGALIGRGQQERTRQEKRRAGETGAFLTSAAITALPLIARSPAILRLGVPAAAIAAVALLRGRSQDD